MPYGLPVAWWWRNGPGGGPPTGDVRPIGRGGFIIADGAADMKGGIDDGPALPMSMEGGAAIGPDANWFIEGAALLGLLDKDKLSMSIFRRPTSLHVAPVILLFCCCCCCCIW